MTDIQKDSEKNEPSPFQDEIVLENYFPVISRTEILSQMQEAIQDGVGVMVLTGQDGSGKTMLCRMFMRQVPSLYTTIFFPHTVDSYEEVVTFMAAELGISDIGGIDRGNVDWALDQITVFLLTESIDLLVIFDEAENIFLATLERIRKLLDRINAAGVRAHILFSGTDTFLENYEQLSLCDFQNSEVLHFKLKPLSQAETADYLRGCSVRFAGKDETKLFSDEVIQKIYSLAKGNFRETSMLGEESVEMHGDDTSFMVLLESVEDGDSTNSGTNAIFQKLSDLFKNNTTYLQWIGIGVCCFLIVLMFFSLGDDDKSAGKGSERTELAEKMPVEQKEPEEIHYLENQQPQEVKKQEQPLLLNVLEDKGGDAAVVLPISEQSGEQIEEGGIEKSGEEEVAASVENEENAQTTKTDIRELEQREENIASQITTGEAVKKSDPSAEQPQKKLLTENQKKIVKKPLAKIPPSADLLFNQRVNAGSSWMKNDRQATYTVQLMVLTSETAEDNLKRMFAQDSYRQEAGNFYIFRKKGMPEKLFVFYGEYQSMERARLVRNSLPQFLRDQQPYAISTKEAIAKVK